MRSPELKRSRLNLSIGGQLSRALGLLFLAGAMSSCSPTMPSSATAPEEGSFPPVASTPTTATAGDGPYISWKEHRIDDERISGVALSGSDGLTMGDLDLDGFPDIVSVHESDTVYDGVARGHIRIAYGSADPNEWELVTLAEGPEAGAAEDVDIADVNGDGFPDIIAACEIEHLIYFQNPGRDIRTTRWDRVIPEITANRGSWIRAFFADFNQDGRPEVVAPNKGSQSPGRVAAELYPISWFSITGDPLDGNNWTEHQLTSVNIPENSRPLDLDGDGDLDILGASRGEDRIFWFENMEGSSIRFTEHRIHAGNDAESRPVRGVNVTLADLNKDGRIDIIATDENPRSNLLWLEQPADPTDPNAQWNVHPIGSVSPDSLIGMVAADIDGDGDFDVMTGTYSGGPRNHDGPEKTPEDNLGRLAWFENPGQVGGEWIRHDISRRIRGMFDKFVPLDLDGDGDIDFVSTRGNSVPNDGVFWLEQVRTDNPVPRFVRANEDDSKEMPLPAHQRE